MSIDRSELLLKNISQLFNNSNNYDVKIIVGKDDNVKKFNAHSVILRTRSNYFNIVLNKWTKNVIIPHINPHVFKIILK
jgi:BTB/POZ domain